MRIDTKKYLFMGLNHERELFFRRAQDAGIIHFVNMHGERHESSSREVETIIHAIKILRGLPVMEQEETEEYALADGIAYKIVDFKGRLDKLSEELRMLKLEMARVAIFGKFSTDDVRYIEEKGGRKVRFFCQKAGAFPEEERPEGMIFIGREMDLDYFVLVSDKPYSREGLVEMFIDRPFDVLQERAAVVDKEIHGMHERILQYAKYSTFLHKALLFRLDKQNLSTAVAFSKQEMDGQFFAVEGWVPVSKVAEMESLTEEMHVLADEIAPDDGDVAPTCLENDGLQRVGEDLVHIYDTPSNTDNDPSLWVLGFFSLFFAMIIGDGGYGLVFLAGALYARYRFGEPKGAWLRFWKLVLVLGTACLLWGFVTASFFGIPLMPDNPIRAYAPLTWLSKKKLDYHIQNDTEYYKEAIAPQLAEDSSEKATFEMAAKLSNGIMMEIALTVGVLHVCIGYLRYIRRTWAGAGWILAILGAYIYLPVYMNAPSLFNYVFGVSFASAEVEGRVMMQVGVGLALLLSFLQHRWWVVLEPTVVIQIFADILSYLRLYALGLAGGIISSIIFDFATSANVLVGAFLIVCGHILNLVLATVGGVIHGLRLNFLEWYHYCFEGGGKMYNPLRRLSPGKLSK